MIHRHEEKDKRKQMVSEEDPFVPKSMAVPLVKDFKQSMIEAYDGVMKPLDGMDFVDLIKLYAALDAMRYLSLPQY